MPDIYGNLNIFGIITVGEEISGGFSLPTEITIQGDVIGIKPDNTVGFINLNESPYNYAKLSDIVAASGAPTYFQQLNDTPSSFTNSSNLVVTVNDAETDLEFTIPNKIFDRINQTSHGFDVGDALYSTSGSFALAIADTSNPGKAEVLGVVSKVLDADNFDITYEGRISGLSGLTSGAVYFLSPLVPGMLTTSKPSGLTIAKPVMVAINDTEAVVVNYVGYVSLANATDAARYFVPNSKTKNSDYTLDQNDYYVRVDTSSGDITLTLPLSSLNENRKYKIKKISNSNKLFVVTTGGDTILSDSSSTSLEMNDLDAAEFIADGNTTWDVN